LAAFLAAVAVIVAVSGGFRTTVGGLRISARSPLPILLLAFINFTTWLSWARRAHSISADLESAWRGIERNSSRLIGVAALLAAIVASAFATRSAAGADASGYLSEAKAWITARPPLHVELLVQDFPQLDGWITTPLGWRPADGGEVRAPGLQVPTYPPGLPLLMAIPHALDGINGANIIVVASAAAAVWATGMLAGGVAGVLAAMIIAFSPIFTNQSIQPMSDVPVTAAWMLCFLLAQRQRSLAAGVACAIAVLIRPNLAPLAIVPLLIAQRRLMFATPVAVAGIFLAVINSVWYGSPLRSGYGSTEELFAFTNIAANAPRYFNWLISTAPPLLLSVFGFWRLRRDRNTQAMLGFVVLVVLSYLVYAVFDDWSYLRFLLPALAVLAVFTAIELAAWIARWPMTYRAPLMFALVLLVTAHGIWVARSRDTFKLANQLRRVAAVADYIHADIPPSAVILSGEQSGSMRYYTDRPILRWEAATPETLTAATATLEQSRRPVYIVLDAWEQGPFRTKFSSLPAGALDWPPILDAGTSHRTQLWKLSDRDRFVRGENLTTIRLP
jgi:type II secretory pathway component PulM